MTVVAAHRCVDLFVQAIPNASVQTLDGVWSDDAVLDATVPSWRFPVTGAAAIRDAFASWYNAAGSFEQVCRTPLPNGELVEFLLSWPQDGQTWRAHQAHVLTVAGDRIVRHTAFCGGRWDEQTQAEMPNGGR